MMVTIIENCASIEGIICSIQQDPSLNNYFQIELELRKSANVGNFPNLAKADVGEIIRINIRSDQFSNHSIKAGDEFSGKIKKGLCQIYFMES